MTAPPHRRLVTENRLLDGGDLRDEILAAANVLPPVGGGDDSAALLAHIESDAPHPAYDVRMPSLRLIFENGLI